MLVRNRAYMRAGHLTSPGHFPAGRNSEDSVTRRAVVGTALPVLIAEFAQAILVSAATSGRRSGSEGRPEVGRLIVRIGERGAAQREASAADVLRQPPLQALELGDPLVDPGGPCPGEA